MEWLEVLQVAISQLRARGAKDIEIRLSPVMAAQVVRELNQHMMIVGAATGQPVFVMQGDLNGAMLFGAFVKVDKEMGKRWAVYERPSDGTVRP